MDKINTYGEHCAFLGDMEPPRASFKDVTLGEKKKVFEYPLGVYILKYIFNWCSPWPVGLSRHSEGAIQ